jgi:hypothetical protein
MAKPDRTAFARKHRTWLIPIFAVLLLLGLLRGNTFAVIGGVFGLVWVGMAIRAGR